MTVKVRVGRSSPSRRNCFFSLFTFPLTARGNIPWEGANLLPATIKSDDIRHFPQHPRPSQGQPANALLLEDINDGLYHVELNRNVR